MNPTLFSQAIDETFPNLDSETRIEIRQKVSSHILEFLKEKVYANDPNGLQLLNQMTDEELDVTKRSEAYGKQILGKFASLSTDEQIKIDNELNEELTRVMHEIYKNYE